MHEYSLVSALLDQARAEAQRHGAVLVHRLHVQVGELAGVDMGLFRTAFDLFRQPSLFRHTELALEPVAAQWECPRCQQALVRGGVLRCPTCQVPARLAAGDELVLARLEMEVADV